MEYECKCKLKCSVEMRLLLFVSQDRIDYLSCAFGYKGLIRVIIFYIRQMTGRKTSEWKPEIRLNGFDLPIRNKGLGFYA